MVYIYRCNKCHHEFDKDLKLSQVINAARPPKFLCPECGGHTRKLINKPNIHYKGEGFTLSKKQNDQP